jgi:hypothetical protein
MTKLYLYEECRLLGCGAVLFPLGLSLQPPANTSASLANFDTLKMEAIHSSETSVNTRPTQRHIPEDDILHSHRCESLISYILYLYVYRMSLLSCYHSLQLTGVFRHFTECKDWKQVGWPELNAWRVPVVGSAQPSIQWILGALFLGGKHKHSTICVHGICLIKCMMDFTFNLYSIPLGNCWCRTTKCAPPLSNPSK